MKKALSISFALLLLVSTVGITIHKHYCNSTLVATSILPHSDVEGCMTDMPFHSDSCQDQHVKYNVDSPLVLIAVNFDLTPSVEWIEVLPAEIALSLANNLSTPKISADLSPPPSEPNIYTKVQSFLL